MFACARGPPTQAHAKGKCVFFRGRMCGFHHTPSFIFLDYMAKIEEESRGKGSENEKEWSEWVLFTVEITVWNTADDLPGGSRETYPAYCHDSGKHGERDKRRERDEGRKTSGRCWVMLSVPTTIVAVAFTVGHWDVDVESPGSCICGDGSFRAVSMLRSLLTQLANII